MVCEGCIYREVNTTEDAMRCVDCNRAYPEGTLGHSLGEDKYEEDQALKKCWDCKNLERDYPECNVKSLNVILELTLEQIQKCGEFTKL